MRRIRTRLGLLFVVGVLAAVALPQLGSSAAPRQSGGIPEGGASALAVLRSSANDLGMGDPDLPPVGRAIDPARYLVARANQVALYRGAPFTLGYNAREAAVQKLQRQLARRGKAGPVWNPIGPAPIPNGQTSPSNPVSGRVTAIAVDPSNASTVYVGTAQGGLYRSTNGGTNWTAMMDNKESLAIGALALSADGSKLYVGTGEGNLSGDSYAGVGLYRIDSPSGSFTVNGPFETRVAGTGTTAGNGHAFQFESITGIAVDPANAARVYVASTPGGIGMAGDWQCCVNPAAAVGLYLSANATSGTPNFSLVAGGLPSGTFGATDVVFLPGSSSTLLVGMEDISFSTSANNGVWRTTTGNTATPAFTHIGLPLTAFNTRLAASSATVLVGTETSSGGRLFKSTDSGATFPTTLSTANGFCGGQCFYDMAPAINPGDATKMLLGGSADSNGANVLMRSTDGTSFSSSDAGLHADSHATAYAPSNPSIVYAGNDGGIFKSTDGGANWTSLNNSQFSATQFESVAVHPTNASFTIGGTQDNGTPFRSSGGLWTRADFGDGGFAAIDQNATNTSAVTMYHTYFNQQNGLVGYAFVTQVANAHDNGWGFRGCGDGVTTANNISCSENPLFYAPLEVGPGSPNTVYYGTDRLHRSANTGSTNPVVSQTFAGGSSGRISAIGISPQNDSVRIVGLNGGGIFGTSTGANPLVNKDPSSVIPNRYVARVVIAPNNTNTAYVTLDGFMGGTSSSLSHVWKTTNFSAATPSWAGINSGLPDVPANAFVVDPANPSRLFVGTDIGVYVSTNGGGTWSPFGTGLPRVAVFDMAIAAPGTSNEILRAATHGKGMWDAALGGGGGPDTTPPHASMLKPAKTLQFSKTIALQWTGGDNSGGSGLQDFTVKMRKAPTRGTFGPLSNITALTHTHLTTFNFNGAPGFTYCFAVQARDNANNVSPVSGQKCTEVPFDDKPMTASAGWTRKTGQPTFLGTLSVTSQHNATLKLTNVHAKRVGVLARTCPGCGEIQMLFAGVSRGFVNLNDTTSRNIFALGLSPSTTVKIGTLTIKVVSSGHKVQIDGIIANLNKAPTFTVERSAALATRALR